MSRFRTMANEAKVMARSRPFEDRHPSVDADSRSGRSSETPRTLLSEGRDRDFGFSSGWDRPSRRRGHTQSERCLGQGCPPTFGDVGSWEEVSIATSQQGRRSPRPAPQTRRIGTLSVSVKARVQVALFWLVATSDLSPFRLRCANAPGTMTTAGPLPAFSTASLVPSFEATDARCAWSSS